MATLSATRSSSKLPVTKGAGAGQLCVAHGSYTVLVDPDPADIIEFCRVPKGAVVVGGWFGGPDLDTNGSETFDIDIGWAANGDEVASTAGFGNLGVQTGDVSVHLGVASIWVPLQGVLLTAGPKTFNAETLLIGTVVDDAATFNESTLSLVVYYYVP